MPLFFYECAVNEVLEGLPIQDETMAARRRDAREQGGWLGRVLQLNFTHTWGDKWYLGLTGIEVLGAGSNPCSLFAHMHRRPIYSAERAAA